MDISYLYFFLIVIIFFSVGYLLRGLYKKSITKYNGGYLGEGGRVIPPVIRAYPFQEEDKVLVKNILGLKEIKRKFEKSNKPIFLFSLSPTSTIQEVSDFLSTIPYEFELKIPSLYNSTVNNILKFVLIRREKNVFLMQQHNHGGLNRLDGMELDKLTTTIYNSRHYPENKLFEVYRQE
jgi:hypothetical protein